MNWPIARSSRANGPLRTTKRATAILAAVAKSMAGDRRRCRPPARRGLGSKAKARGSPQRRSSRLAVSSGPSGTSSASTFGSSARRVSSAWRATSSLASRIFKRSLSCATWSSSSGSGLPSGPRRWPISFESRFLSAWSSCTRVSTSATPVEADELGRSRRQPRLCSSKSKASGCSRNTSDHAWECCSRSISPPLSSRPSRKRNRMKKDVGR